MASCQKFELHQSHEQTTNTKSQLSTTPQFTVENGMLVFETEEDFAQVLQFVSTMNIDEYLDWCKKLNINTLQQSYIKALQSQFEYENQIQLIKEKDPNYNPTQEESSFMQQEIENNRIKKQKNSDGDVYYEIVSCRSNLAFLLNNNKMVSINGDIYQYNNENIKIIKNKQYSKIDIIERINNTTSDSSIIVWEQNSTKFESSYDYALHDDIGTLQYYDKRRLDYQVKVRSQQNTYGGLYYLTLYVNMWHYKNNSLNICNKLGILKGTSFTVVKTFKIQGVATEITLGTHEFSSDNIVNKVKFYTFYLLNGGYPENIGNPNIVHMPHLKPDNKIIKMYVQDVYWWFGNNYVSGISNFTISKEQFLGL